MKMKTLAAAALAVSALPAVAAEKLSLADVLSASDVSISGRVDVSYDYTNTQGGAAPALVGFNADSNSFVLHQAALNIVKAPAAGVGGAVTVLLGEDAKLLGGDSGNSQIALLQGYVSYTGDKYSLQAGRMLTLAGAEVIDSSANFNATRGLLFFFQPVYHTGVRGTYKLADGLSVTGGLMNSSFIGNQDSNTSNGEAKTLELNAVYTKGAFTSALTAYLGDEAGDKESGFTSVIDYVGTYALSDATTLVLNADYFATELSSNNTADGYGFALYGNHKLGKACRVAARAEYVHSNEATVGRNLSAYTLTYGHTVADGLEMMVEARADWAAGDNVYPTADPDSQYTGVIKAVYKF